MVTFLFGLVNIPPLARADPATPGPTARPVPAARSGSDSYEKDACEQAVALLISKLNCGDPPARVTAILPDIPTTLLLVL